MVFVDMLANAVRAVLPRKSLDQVIEEQNTTTVWYPRVHGLPQKYVYGKRPGEPLVKTERHPEGRKPPSCKSETDQATIERHIAICRSTEGSHGGLCEMCRKLGNPKRFDFLARLYRDERPMEFAGFNVSGAVDGAKVNWSATSVYLKGLADLGLIRRERAGRLVNYSPDFSLAQPCVAEIARLMRERLMGDPNDMSFVPIFRAMMGSRRSQIVRHLAAGGCGRIDYLRERFNVLRLSDLERDLRFAIDAHILDLDSQDPDGTYTYITPADPIARRVVELS